MSVLVDVIRGAFWRDVFMLDRNNFTLRILRDVGQGKFKNTME
jgi:hypothetical protein